MEFDDISAKMKVFIDRDEVDKFMNLERHSLASRKLPYVSVPTVFIICRQNDCVYVGSAASGSLHSDVGSLLATASNDREFTIVYMGYYHDGKLAKDTTSWRSFRIDLRIETYLRDNVWNRRFNVNDYNIAYVHMPNYVEAKFWEGALIRALRPCCNCEVHSDDNFVSEKRARLMASATEWQQLFLLKKNPMLIKAIKHPSVSAQLTAVRKEAEVIRYIRNPPVNVQLAAIKQAPDIIVNIDNCDEGVQIRALKKRPDVFFSNAGS